MRLRASTRGELAREVDGPVEGQAAVVVEVNVQLLEIRRCVDNADRARLHKVVGHQQMFLVGRDLDVVRADGRLDLVRVVEALDVVEVRDVKGRDVVGGCQRDWREWMLADCLCSRLGVQEGGNTYNTRICRPE